MRLHSFAPLVPALVALAASPSGQKFPPPHRPVVGPPVPIERVVVDDDFGPWTLGWGVTCFDRIQDGIAAAAPDGTVFVRDGTYAEAVLLDVPVRLVGQSTSSTVLAPIDGWEPLWLTADGARVRRFRIENTGAYPSAFRVFADDCVLQELVIYGTPLDAYVRKGADRTTLRDIHGLRGLWLGSALPERSSGNRVFGCSMQFLGLEHQDGAVVRGNTIDPGLLYGVSVGLYVTDDSEISGNTIVSQYKQIRLDASRRNAIVDNDLDGTTAEVGIELVEGSDDCIVSGNCIQDGQICVEVVRSDRPEIAENHLEPTTRSGIELYQSEGARVLDNEIVGGGLWIHGDVLSEWVHEVDGNRVDGRPIRYFEGVSGVVVPSDTAQAILVACPGFVVRGLEPSRVHAGIVAAYSPDGVVRECTLRDCWYGVELRSSSNVDVLDNFLVDVDSGISILDAVGGRILRNHVSARYWRQNTGILAVRSDGLEIADNLVARFWSGLRANQCAVGGNTIHRNRFVDVVKFWDDCADAWDDGALGNFWGDYTGEDPDGNGIGNTPVPIDGGSNVDRFPSMQPPGGTALWASAHSLSVSDGGRVDFFLDAGPAYARQAYVVLGSASGTSPGLRFFGALFPLSADDYLLWTVNRPQTHPVRGFQGTLDGDGLATASFRLVPGEDPSLAGLVLHHAAAPLILSRRGPKLGLVRAEAVSDPVPLFLDP